MKEMVLPEDFEGRLASLHLSTMRVTKATTFRASTSSTSHITIVGPNIVDPFRPSIAFVSDTSVTDVLFLTLKSAVA
jgi:hypothetical protein